MAETGWQLWWAVLRNALHLAALGFGVADLAIATGALLFLRGIAFLSLAISANFWFT